MQEFSPLTAMERKEIAALRRASERRLRGAFTVEGSRAVIDTAACFTVDLVVATPHWLQENASRLPKGVEIKRASAADLERISNMQTPQGVLAVCRIPAAVEVDDFQPSPGELLLALDCIQDPGNMGTIIRVADWFGVRHIIASADTVDVYNPKVVQATMGSLARVEVIYTPELPAALQRLGAEMPIYGTSLDGDNLYSAPLTPGGVVVMGNEGRGLSQPVYDTLTHRLRIPEYPAGASTVESLNVAMATGITLAEFRRRL